MKFCNCLLRQVISGLHAFARKVSSLAKYLYGFFSFNWANVGARPHAQARTLNQIGKLNVVPSSNPLGINLFVSGISISLKCECYIIMQIHYTKNLNPCRSESANLVSGV